MNTTAFSLEKLLAPIPLAGFLAGTWEKQPLSIQRQSRGYYAGLFSLADLDAVIAFSRPRFTEPGVFPGTPSSSRTCVQGWLPDQMLVPADIYPDIGELRQVFGQGKTIVVRGMQHRWPAIASLCRNLEGLFHCPVHCNLYLTPPRAQGFDAHFDPHEVFALQIDGVKHWRLYGAAADLPLAREKANVARSRLGPPREIRMEPGDLLYIPRGHAHEAATTDRFSLHLTVGVNVQRWADLLHQAVDHLSRRDARFREGLAPGLLLEPETWPAVNGRFRELLQIVAQNALAEDALRRLGDEFLAGLAVLPGDHFAPAAGVDALDLDTVLRKNPGALCRILSAGDEVLLHFPGGQVSLPARMAASLRLIARSDRLAVRDLPDDLGDAAKLALARRLVREGLLRIEAANTIGEAGYQVNGAVPHWQEIGAPQLNTV